MNIQEDRAAARKAHFKAGRTLTMWLGAARTFHDRKKVTDKQACRAWRAKEAR